MIAESEFEAIAEIAARICDLRDSKRLIDERNESARALLLCDIIATKRELRHLQAQRILQ